MTRVANSQVRSFWLGEYEGYLARFRAEAIAPIQNKVGAFLADPTLWSILTQSRSSFDLRRMMDEGKSCRQPRGNTRRGYGRATGPFVSRIAVSALSRADQVEEERRDFFAYLDEFQTFTTLSLGTMLSELRKYRTNLVLAHQYLGQLDEKVRDAILGNAGTLVAFRIGPEDAEIFEREFDPDFRASDLASLPNHQAYVKIMVDGAVSRPFSAETLGANPGASCIVRNSP